MTYILSELLEAKKERDKLLKEVKMYASVNDSLIEDNEALKKKLDQCETLWKATAQTLQAEIDRLRTELRDERDRFDRLSDFELERDKMLQAAREEVTDWTDRFQIVMLLLAREGYNTDRLTHMIATVRAINKAFAK